LDGSREAARDTNAVRDRLALPPLEGGYRDLLAGWFQSDVVLTIGPRAPDDVAGDPAAANRIRGAWGRALMETASGPAIAGQPCPWSPPCALDVLFGEMGNVRRGVVLPKPYVVRVDSPCPGWLEVRLSLFGFAVDWLEAAGEALVRAFRHPLSLDGRARRPYDPYARILEEDIIPFASRVTPESLSTLMASTQDGEAAITLVFTTPFCPRRAGDWAFDPLALLTGLSRRSEGMARWHDARLRVSGDALSAAARALTLDVSAMAPHQWVRPPNRGRDRGIPQGGLLGPCRLTGPAPALAEVLPLLVLGESFGAGSHTALGLGRYHLTDRWPP
jgi:hypothetical protein